MSELQLQSHSQSLIDVFPGELILTIVENVDPVDYLSLKLSCKTVAKWMPLDLEEFMRRKHEDPTSSFTYGDKAFLKRKKMAEAHAHAEASTRSPSTPSTPIICTVCCKRKPRNDFTDGQSVPFSDAARKPFRRNCISCGVRANRGLPSYSEREYILVDKERRFACPYCCTALSFSQHYEGDEYPLPDARIVHIRKNACKPCAVHSLETYARHFEARLRLRKQRKEQRASDEYAQLCRALAEQTLGEVLADCVVPEEQQQLHQDEAQKQQVSGSATASSTDPETEVEANTSTRLREHNTAAQLQQTSLIDQQLDPLPDTAIRLVAVSES